MTHGGGAGLLVLGDGAEVDLIVAGDDDPRNLVAVGIGGGEVLLEPGQLVAARGDDGHGGDVDQAHVDACGAGGA